MIAQRVTIAHLEGLNTKIQWHRRSARGFRNRDRFNNDVYSRLGGLDLYPASFTQASC